VASPNKTSSFDDPACLNQEVKLYGGENPFFARGLKGLQKVVSFVNLKRTQSGFVMLNDNMDTSIIASTPVYLERDRNFFNADKADVPDNLPAALALQNEINKNIALYTTDNNVSVKRRQVRNEKTKYVSYIYIYLLT
jgi:hypothetical protein